MKPEHLTDEEISSQQDTEDNNSQPTEYVDLGGIHLYLWDSEEDTENTSDVDEQEIDEWV